MPSFTVAWNYRSNRGTLTAGAVVEMSQAEADWYNIDSPGVLVPYVEPPKPERAKPATPDRQHKGGPNRGRA